MAAHKSDEYTIVATQPISSPLDPTQDKGRVRISHFNFGAITSAAADTLDLCFLPAGKVRVLRLCIAARSAFGAGTTIALGHAGYTNRTTGAAVAASAAAFLAAFAADATTKVDELIDVAIDSRSGFLVRFTTAVGAGTAETMNGWLEYVVD